MESQFDDFAAALKSTLDFCRDPDVRLTTASLLQPIASLYPIIYYVAKQRNCSIADADRRRIKTALYFLLFNRFLRSKSPEARIRWLREALNYREDGGFPVRKCLEVVGKRQKWSWTETSIEMLNENPNLTLNIVQPSVVRNTYSWQSRPEVDHIFPQSIYLLAYPELVNDIGNLAFLGKLRNIRKSNQEPWEYFTGVSDEALDEDFLIDRQLLSKDQFAKFVETRRTRILSSVIDFLGR
jgi:hypothetical protein